MTFAEFLGRENASLAEATAQIFESAKWMRPANDRSPEELLAWCRIMLGKHAALAALLSGVEHPTAQEMARVSRLEVATFRHQIEEFEAYFEGSPTCR